MITEKQYNQAKEVVRKYDNKTASLSFYLMRDNHTFTKPSGETLEEIRDSFIKLVKDNSYSSVCPVVILDKDGKEVRRVGKMAHARKTEIDLTEWFNEVSKDSDVIELMKRKAVSK